jgi:poly(3-hydroxybutyrate) depolymerase
LSSCSRRTGLVKGSFVGMSRALELKDITRPVYLLAGASDDITTREQVFDAETYIVTPKDRVEKKLVPGGHIGLFMGSRTLAQTWPEIAGWMAR